MTGMASEVGGEDYKSPVRKLVAFFKRSRDKWKLKMAKAKKELKRLENRVRFLEKSRDHWKDKARELEAKNARLQAEGRQRSAESEAEAANPPEKKAKAPSSS
jgi:hypothetical protein